MRAWLGHRWARVVSTARPLRAAASVAAGWPVPATGLVLVAAGLALPWLGVPLESERGAWGLSVAVAGLPRVAWVSYGLLVGIGLLLAAIALIRVPRRPSPMLGAASVLIVVVAVLFVTLTSISDLQLLQHLTAQSAELASVNRQLGYRVPRIAPTSLLFIPLPGAWRTVAAAVRPGWFATILGGGLLLTWSARSTVASLAATRLRTRLLLIAAVVVAAVGLLLRPVAANLLANAGITAAQSGDYETAAARFSLMNQLDPEMRYRSGIEVAWGTALRGLGDQASPMALLADSHAAEASGDSVKQLDELRRAGQAAPDDPVIAHEYIGAMVRAAQRTGVTAPLLELVGTPLGDLPAEHYALARIYFRGADYTDAVAQLDRVLDETDEPNTRSTAYTYRALAELHLGLRAEERRDLLRAVAADVEYNNSLARSLATGLYQAIPA